MRTHYCGQLNEKSIGTSVTLCGWVQSRRDHGGVIFIDLRDAAGVVQVVFHPEDAEAFAAAEQLRAESVLRVAGEVRARPAGTENPHLATGAVEVVGRTLEVLNRADVLPFQLDEPEVGEAVRLRYRYLDLRRGHMHRNIELRHRITRTLRRFLEERGFTEIETPVLTQSTPEGARDYLVPSRIHPGRFYALPQSPQLFKQLLVISGFERYFQIARCFRDEDLRADRQPEFTQLDIELAFVEENDVMALVEAMLRYLFKEVLDVALPEPFPRIAYAEALQRFGTDRPDLRAPLELVEVADLVRDVEFKVFAEPAARPGARVAALRLPGGAALSRQAIDAYTAFVAEHGAKGLAYIKVNARAEGRAGLQSPILKFLPDAVIESVLERTGAADGDLIFFGADRAEIVDAALGALRVRAAADRGLMREGWFPVWIVDFPMFEYDEQERRWRALHHPFTAPRREDEERIERGPANAKSRAYDLVLNGIELGGGSIRIHRRDVQERVFAVLGIGPQEAQRRFRFLLEALRLGAPPHGGIAFGLDRIVAMMAGADTIRDVIAFPKTQKAACPLTDAPGPVDDGQLRELHLRLRKPTG